MYRAKSQNANFLLICDEDFGEPTYQEQLACLGPDKQVPPKEKIGGARSSCPCRRGVLVTPADVGWIIKRNSADPTSGSLQNADPTSGFLRDAEGAEILP